MTLDTRITVTLTISAEEADQLWVTATANFIPQQPDRFETIAGGDLHAERWAAGTLMWTHSMADAVMLRAYEAAHGYDALMLNDLADYAPFALLSERPIPTF